MTFSAGIAEDSIKPAGDVDVNAHSSTRRLTSENVSERTEETYLQVDTPFPRFRYAQAMPPDVARIRREHMEPFTADLLQRS